MPSFLVPLREPYALPETLFSGQAFRWRRRGRSFRGFIGPSPVTLRTTESGISVSSRDEEMDESRAASYLRAHDPLGSIYRSIANDPAMKMAVHRWRGLHLLAQDPWETTASFIVSSASNIPRISRSLETICARYGARAVGSSASIRAFPSARALARAPQAGLLACGLGYRARYLRSAARSVAEGAVDFDALGKAPTEDARETLVETLDGVGPKVADCILLFSLGKDDAFPVDRWVQRYLSSTYFGGRPLPPREAARWGRARWGNWAGYAQQYIFQDVRAGASSGAAR